jgi:hypothetical protein
MLGEGETYNFFFRRREKISFSGQNIDPWRSDSTMLPLKVGKKMWRSTVYC